MSARATNQAPPLEGHNVFASDRALCDALSRMRPNLDTSEMHELGELAGHPDVIALGFDANSYAPELHTFDRFGNRIDEVRFHPAWHVLMATAAGHGLHAAPWTDERPDAHLRRAVKFFVWSQVESGHGCPISMTYACVPALRAHQEIAQEWIPRFATRSYDPRLLSADAKPSALCGMALTEKQGGSDVRANTMHASRTAQFGVYALKGHKWFCSAPMSDAFLVTAQTEAGTSCLFVPRVLPGGARNPFPIQRLKDKLGNRSNASSEIEFDGTTLGWIVGEEGRGIQTIVEMINYTRMDCVIGSAALMRQAVAQALHHAHHRSTFGSLLVDRPLMQNVLADLALESEGATLLFLRLAQANDEAGSGAFSRIATAIAKYYVCKRTPAMVAEALECLGGNGYIEESIVPRLYRESPVNSLWEGAGNINALDVLRVIAKEPAALDAFREAIAPALSDSDAARYARDLERDIAGSDLEWQARSIVERMAKVLIAAQFVAYAPGEIARAYIDARLKAADTNTFGTLRNQSVLRDIIDRASPATAVLS